MAVAIDHHAARPAFQIVSEPSAESDRAVGCIGRTCGWMQISPFWTLAKDH